MTKILWFWTNVSISPEILNILLQMSYISLLSTRREISQCPEKKSVALSDETNMISTSFKDIFLGIGSLQKMC